MYLNTIFDDLYQINRDLNKFLKTGSRNRASWPEVNIYESQDQYTIVCRTPGIAKEDISITFKDNSLKITGEKKAEKPEKHNYHLKERGSGKFERNVLLHDKIDDSKIDAQMKNGLLLVKVPKAPEAQPKSITIN